MYAPASRSACGSSPLTRGKPCQSRPCRPSARLIPAHAGKTTELILGVDVNRAHPRSRGENVCVGGADPRDVGSSPLTRGKQHRLALIRHLDRLIPAHAGKTPMSHSTNRVERAHPRSRGENNDSGLERVCGWGSSPLTRGKPFIGVPAADPLGLIPAHAGKTNKCGACLSLTSAHPRSRGENLQACVLSEDRHGSSPLTRGKPVPVVVGVEQLGLIPAHAGKTIDAAPARLVSAAHPRSRGENRDIMREMPADHGSSPLTRGKPDVACVVSDPQRLIPAHAGKTSLSATGLDGVEAHPRSRGENSLLTPMLSDKYGSSPLTRGKLDGQSDVRVALGLIPAHAGKTRLPPPR